MAGAFGNPLSAGCNLQRHSQFTLAVISPTNVNLPSHIRHNKTGLAMIASSVVCVIVIALLCIINRRSVPGLANILYAILAVSLLALVTFAFTPVPSSVTAFLTAALCSATVLTVVGAVGAFALMGYQNKRGDRILKFVFGMALVAVSSVSYYFGGDVGAWGAMLGACVPLGWLQYSK